MNKFFNYRDFLKTYGHPLSNINPGSDEIALNIHDALLAIEFLKEAQVAILGGDILSDESGKLTYTYENWYCEKLNNESNDEYLTRSYLITKAYLDSLINKGYGNRYVVIVT